MTHQPVAVTVLNAAGEAVFEAQDLQPTSAVRTVREAVLALQPEVGESTYPWQPEVSIEIVLFLDANAIDDTYLLAGPVVELTCVVSRVEHARVGKPSLEEIVAGIEQHCHAKCLGLYVQGSWVAQYKKPQDVDLFAIVEEREEFGYCEDEVNIGDFHICCFTLEDWIGKLQSMDPSLLPCLSLPEQFVLRRLDDERMYKLKIDMALLRQAVLALADVKWLAAMIGGLHLRHDWGLHLHHDWVRPGGSKEELKDTMSCKKVYFAFRALEMGCQLASTGCITDFQCAIEWYERAIKLACRLKIKEQPEGWDIVQAAFAHDFQQAVARFCAVCDGKPPPAYMRPSPMQVACGLCGRELLEKVPSTGRASPDIDTCYLVNCGHAVHSRCIADWIRKKFNSIPKRDVYNTYGYEGPGSWAPADGTCFVPEPGCLCVTSVGPGAGRRTVGQASVSNLLTNGSGIGAP
eukprot:TRINITY_DN15566_c0_g1_i1.p1 TRINITY_DN15566_c0_g1~~TRINITY_DN15566_c0_g1_i1.p1  ORF type:complete len:480 (-),score=57.20 TRINITY_DN15566_c0_g1_i1:588-1973(-)